MVSDDAGPSWSQSHTGEVSLIWLVDSEEGRSLLDLGTSRLSSEGGCCVFQHLWQRFFSTSWSCIDAWLVVMLEE